MSETEQFEKMLKKAKAACNRAYAPYSDYYVGAAVMGASGKIYAGCNIENAAYGSTMCAERVAIFKAISEGDNGIRAIVICSEGEEFPYPCGACLQVMSEFNEEGSMVIALENGGEIEAHALKELLPMPFKFEV